MLSSMWNSDGRGFTDLCVSSENPPLDALIRLGYSTVALNTTIDESVLVPKKKHKKGEPKDDRDPVPAPKRPPSSYDDKLKIFHRLTIKFSDTNILQKLNRSANFKKYDLIAVMPADKAAFVHACTVMDVDIVSFDCEDCDGFRIHRKLYDQAIERNVYFEIMYSPALKHSTYRKGIIYKANVYKTIGKSKNVLIVSDAENEYQVRGPYEVIRLGYVFGLNSHQAINAITETPRKALLRGDSRRRGTCAIYVRQKQCIANESIIENLKEYEPICKKAKIEL